MQIKQEKLKVNQMKSRIKNILFIYVNSVKNKACFSFLTEGKRSAFEITGAVISCLSASAH